MGKVWVPQIGQPVYGVSSKLSGRQGSILNILGAGHNKKIIIRWSDDSITTENVRAIYLVGQKRKEKAPLIKVNGQLIPRRRRGRPTKQESEVIRKEREQRKLLKEKLMARKKSKGIPEKKKRKLSHSDLSADEDESVSEYSSEASSSRSDEDDEDEEDEDEIKVSTKRSSFSSSSSSLSSSSSISSLSSSDRDSDSDSDISTSSLSSSSSSSWRREKSKKSSSSRRSHDNEKDRRDYKSSKRSSSSWNHSGGGTSSSSSSSSSGSHRQRYHDDNYTTIESTIPLIAPLHKHPYVMEELKRSPSTTSVDTFSKLYTCTMCDAPGRYYVIQHSDIKRSKAGLLHIVTVCDPTALTTCYAKYVLYKTEKMKNKEDKPQKRKHRDTKKEHTEQQLSRRDKDRDRDRDRDRERDGEREKSRSSSKHKHSSRKAS